VKYGYISLIALASVVACAAPGASSEDVGAAVESASSSNGVAATLSVTVSGTTYSGKIVVTNSTAEPVSNWQVLVNMGPRSSDQNKSLISNIQWLQPSGAPAVNGAFINDLGANTLFMPTTSTANISPGGSQTITWSGDWNNHTPAIVSVDGMPSGTANAGNPADGIDPIALAAASTALSIATNYEKDKLPNNGDSNYSIYDQTIWSAQSFRVASGDATIEYDPNMPGYAFIPNSVKASLAFAELDPSVASYLTAGLVSCLGVSDGAWAYAFRADFLKGFSYPTLHKGSVTNSDHSVDNFQVSGAPISHGQSTISISATSGPANADPSFGIFRYLDSAWDQIKGVPTFPNWSTTIQPKFVGSFLNVSTSNSGKWLGRYAAACSPFNGPGGSSNPYFILNQTINGQTQTNSAWFQGVGSGSCQNGCTGTFKVDPAPYTEPGQYYDTNNNPVGMQSNPFTIDSASLYATPDHAGQWATRTVNGVQQWGTFSTLVYQYGAPMYKYVKQM
jgi:hypothetical protein